MDKTAAITSASCPNFAPCYLKSHGKHKQEKNWPESEAFIPTLFQQSSDPLNSWLALSRNKKNISKTIQWMKSRNCDVIGD